MSEKTEFQHELLVVLNKIAKSLDLINDNIVGVSISISSIDERSDSGICESLDDIKNTIKSFYQSY